MLVLNLSAKLRKSSRENGNDSRKSVDKIIQHGKAIIVGAAHDKYEYEKAYRSLWVFENRETMEAVLKRLEGNQFFVNMKEYFLFKPEKEISVDFFGGWRNLDGKERNFFYL